MLKRFAAPFGGSLVWALVILLAPVAYWAGLSLHVPELRERHIDSAEALRRAIGFGESLGLQVREWTPAVNAIVGADHARLARHAVWMNLPLNRRELVPITTIRVVLVAPGKQHWLAVWLRPDGQLHSFDTSPDLLSVGEIPPESVSRAIALAEANRAFPGMNCGDPELETAAAEGTHGARRYLWRNTVLPGLDTTLTVEVHCDRITERTMSLRVNDAELPVPENKINSRFNILLTLFMIVGGLYAVYRFSRRVFEREISWTRTMLIAAALTSFGIAIVIVNPNFAASGVAPDRVASSFSLLIVVSIILSFMLQGMAGAFIYGAGESEMRESYPGKLTSFDALFTGRFTARNVGRSIVFGASAGGWAFLAVRLLHYFAGFSELRERSLSLPYGPAAWFIILLNEPVTAFLTACLSLLLPLLYLSRHFGRTALRRGLAIVFCLVGCGVSGYRPNFDQPTALGFTVVVAALVLLTFWYGDFLASIVALWWLFAFVENHEIAQVIPSWSLHAQGTYALAALSALYGLFISFRGREVSDADVQPQHAHRIQQRLQLEQEVSTAREAQVRLLPEALPQIPGVAIAASCHPAREVGGDFYDFFPLPNQRHGIFVADGSSGGLASALTIGLAKGFLSYAAQRGWPPAQALERLAPVLTQAISSTRHHFSLCYAVLHPAEREIHIARLGNNPRLFHFNQRNRAAGLAMVEEIHPPEDSAAEVKLALSTGDLVLFCTDGLATRIESRLGCSFNEWLQRFEGESSKTAERFHEDLLRILQPTAGDLADDITAVVIEMKVAILQERVA